MKLYNLTKLWLAILAAALVIMAVSCRSTKDVYKETTDKDSTAFQQLQKENSELRTEVSTLRTKIAELEYLGVTFQNCPSLPNIDSLKAVLKASGCRESTVDSVLSLYKQSQSEVEILADGTMRLKGNIASLTRTKQKLEEQVQEKSFMLYKKDVELNIMAAALSTRTDIKDKHTVVEVGPPNWWLWLALVVFIGGMWVENKLKLISKLKK